MSLAYLRSDADRAAGVGIARVLVREAAGCARDVVEGGWRARGASRLAAPYWMARRFLGAAGRPLDDDALILLTFDTPGDPAHVCIRRNQSDLLILWQIFLRRFYELEAAYLLDDHIDRLDTIVDLGGNTGLAASYLTARYRPARLLTVEPIPENLAVLRRNAALSGLDWIIEDCAASGHSGELDFAVSGFWDTCTAVPDVAELRRTRPYRLENVLERPARTVRACTVGELLERHGVDHVDLMKVDIEGSEIDVFDRHHPWMERVERLVLEIHDKYIAGDRVRAVLKEAGLRRVPPRAPDPVGFNPVELYVR